MSSSPWKGYVLSYTLFSLGELQFIGLALCDPAHASMCTCAYRYVYSRGSQRSTWGVFLSYSPHSLSALASFSLFSDTPKCPHFQRDFILSHQKAFGSISNPSSPLLTCELLQWIWPTLPVSCPSHPPSIGSCFLYFVVTTFLRAISDLWYQSLQVFSQVQFPLTLFYHLILLASLSLALNPFDFLFP